MSPSPLSLPRDDLSDQMTQHKAFGIATPIGFASATVLLLALFSWPLKWLISGAPTLTFCVLLGASQGHRVLPGLPLWTLLTTLHLAYFIGSTSWLLYWVFAASCYPLIFLTCLFQFDFFANSIRRNLRSVLNQLQFINDKIAFFDIPALEIDTDVDGLMVVRGLTISLSSLTIVAHGIEVGIKLSDDMELAIQTEKVTIALFRSIVIGDCYANLKGGAYEMTFGTLDDKSEATGGEALMVEDTQLLQMAAAKGDKSRPKMVKMTSRMTDGESLKDSSAKSVFNSMTQLSPDDDHAYKKYTSTINWIEESNAVHEAHETIKRLVKTEAKEDKEFDPNNQNDVRAAICSQLHNKPSVPHPPRRSIKVTTLQNLSPPWVRTFLHRLPMLLRLLLNPLAYFHPVSISSITAAGSGKWITHMLRDNIFKDYGEDSAEIRRLETRIQAWLSDANFALSLADIKGLAQVPFLSAYDIVCLLTFGDVMAYRTLSKEVDLKQVVRLGGADAQFTIPSFLLPHHEHLLPEYPKQGDKEILKQEVADADGAPKTIQKEQELEQFEKDEANVKMSVHARLPACFDQELLNFIAALVKATKVVELEKEPNAMDEEVTGFKDFAKSLNRGMKDTMKRAVVDGIVNDKWIAKMVGKITKKLETAMGDIGYSGMIPVALAPYRLPKDHVENFKILA